MADEMPRARALIGTSGWVYKHWKNVFYPAGLPAKASLSYYAERFPTVEINYSFYRLPSRDNFIAWRQGTPNDFIFAVKASRYLTHMKKLSDPEPGLERLFDRVSGLDHKLGPILFQLPPRWGKNVPRLVDFLAHLPPGHRYAFEFRDASWFSADVYTALSDRGAALVLSDFHDLPLPLVATAAFTYIRLHGSRPAPCYDAEALTTWADRIQRYLADGVDVYAYFNNDPLGCAPRDAATLTRLVADREP